MEAILIPKTTKLILWKKNEIQNSSCTLIRYLDLNHRRFGQMPVRPQLLKAAVDGVRRKLC